MSRLRSLWRVPRGFVFGLALGLVVASAGVVAAGGLHPPKIITPKTASQVTNLDILRSEIKNYYGTPGAAAGSGATAGWTLALNTSSNYAKEAAKVAKSGRLWLDAKAESHKYPMKAIVLDVDDTTLTTWDYELYSNWDYLPSSNTAFVGGTNTAFTGNVFPAAPGMVQMVQVAHALGYAVFFVTGRPDSQHYPTIANLVSDRAAGYADVTTVTTLSAPVPDVDAGYPMPTAVETYHGAAYNSGVTFADGLFTKPDKGDYPAYLDQPQFCAAYIHAIPVASCPTIQYKSGTRAYIESLGYTIVGNFGDQFSDLLGGFAVKNFKMPNPNYYLP